MTGKANSVAGNKIQYLFFTYDFPPNRSGGMANYFDGLIRHFDPMHSQVITTGAQKSIAFDKIFPAAIVRMPVRKPVFAAIFCFIYCSWALVRYKRIFIHCGNATPFRHIAVLMKKLFGARYAVYFFGNDLHRLVKKIKMSLFSRLLTQFEMNNADAIIACSTYTRNLAMSSFNIPEERALICFPGLDDEYLAKNVAPSQFSGPQPLKLISIGRLTPRKGFDIVIKALGELKKKNVAVSYTLVGKGKQDSFKEIARQCGVNEHVNFAGYLKHARDVETLVLQSDVLIMPSRIENGIDVEGFGIVFLEAAALKRPAIGSRSGGIPDAVIDNKTGLLVSDSNSPQCIAEAIVRYAQNPEMLRQHAENAYEHANTYFRWNMLAEDLREKLAGILHF